MDDLPVLKQRALFATIACWIVAVLAAGMVFGELAHLAGIVDLLAVELDPLSALVAMLYLAFLIAFLVSVVLVAMWIHRAHKRLQEAGHALNFTPGWAVGWYFIPIANLVQPYNAMKELWNLSHGEDEEFKNEGNGRLGLWWGMWLVGNIVSNISQRMVESESADWIQIGFVLGAIGAAGTLAAAVLLAGIIKQVTKVQESGVMSAQIFE